MVRNRPTGARAGPPATAAWRGARAFHHDASTPRGWHQESSSCSACWARTPGWTRTASAPATSRRRTGRGWPRPSRPRRSWTVIPGCTSRAFPPVRRNSTPRSGCGNTARPSSRATRSEANRGATREIRPASLLAEPDPAEPAGTTTRSPTRSHSGGRRLASGEDSSST